MVVLVIISLVVGILVGTHAPWWAEVALIVGGGIAIEKSNLEMGALLFVPSLMAFAVGCLIGDISWAFQTGAIQFNFGVGNPFSVND